MSNVRSKKTPRAPPPCRSIYRVHYALPKHEGEMTRPLPTAMTDVQAYGAQVAGHRLEEQDKYIGLLQSNNGTVLKPLIKECQRREIDFYKAVTSSDVEDLRELRGLVPKYFGCRKYTYNGHEMEYIVLEDLSLNMLEPCIMDVKIGRRTWDPLATEEKMMKESSKYADSKREFCFCIPGYQVYKVSSGKLYKYGKDHGKKLKGHMVKDTIRNYLNGSGRRLCRTLVLQFLTALWRVQRWSSHQHSLKLYSSSLLLLYDARRRRECCGGDDTSKTKCQPADYPQRRKSIHSMHSVATNGSFSGQLTDSGPHYKKLTSVPITPITLAQKTFSTPPPITNSPWSQALDKLNNSHSFEHNYEDKLSKIKINYKSLLDELSNDTNGQAPWATVKIIDFAHAFFNDSDGEGLDYNFKEGIDNLVSIFEAFLKETDDQVF